MLSADARGRAWIGRCRSTRRKDDEKRPRSAVRFISDVVVYAHFHLSWDCRYELVLRIELVGKITPLVPKFATATDFLRMR